MPKIRCQLPQDPEAERALIGCLLMGADLPDLNPELWFHEGRALIVVILNRLKSESWTSPKTDHPSERLAAARMNLEKAAYGIEANRLWNMAGSVREELEACLESPIRPEDADFFLSRLIEAKARRDLIAIHQNRLDAAYSGDLTAAADGTELMLPDSLGVFSRSSEPILLRLSDVQPESISWLWPGRIPAGKLTLIVGDPGLGKSILTADLAARVSQSGLWPDGQISNATGGVVMLSAEDAPGDTIRPRLDAAGGSPERITLLQGVARYDPKNKRKVGQPVSLQRDLDAIRKAIERTPDCRLVIIDPINAYIGGIDNHKDSELRTVLTPLCELARETGVALVGISHLNKSNAAPAIYRTMGSMGFVAAARVVWMIVKDPEDSEGHRRLMLPVKANLGPDTGGLAYEIKITPTGQPVLAWEENPVSGTVDQILSAREEKRPPKASPALSEAKDWLQQELAMGPLPSTELFSRATHDGIKEATLRRAKESLGIKVTREGFGDAGQWIWQLPTPLAVPSKSSSMEEIPDR